MIAFKKATLKKSICLKKKMNEVRARNKIEVKIHQEKVDFINDVYEKELRHWKRAALEIVSTENEAKELIDLAPSRVILVRKVKNKKMVNIDEIIFYLNFQYLAQNDEQRTFIQHIPSEENMLFFEAITGYLKTFSKSIKKDENMSLKNKTLIGGRILIPSKVYRRENLTCRFEDWLYEECKIKRQTSYNYRNLYKLMSVAPKFVNCRVYETHFFKNHEILFKYFDEMETQVPWKHVFSCTCEDYISYFFGEPATVY